MSKENHSQHRLTVAISSWTMFWSASHFVRKESLLGKAANSQQETNVAVDVVFVCLPFESRVPHQTKFEQSSWADVNVWMQAVHRRRTKVMTDIRRWRSTNIADSNQYLGDRARERGNQRMRKHINFCLCMLC